MNVDYIGITDESDVCECCGRRGLKRVVRLAVLDADGNREDEVRYGVDCAARAIGRTSAAVRRDAEAAQARLESEAAIAAELRTAYAAALEAFRRFRAGDEAAHADTFLVRARTSYNNCRTALGMDPVAYHGMGFMAYMEHVAEHGAFPSAQG